MRGEALGVAPECLRSFCGEDLARLFNQLSGFAPRSKFKRLLVAPRSVRSGLVEEAGQAAVARELGVSRQAIADRLRRIRANRKGRSGRR